MGVFSVEEEAAHQKDMDRRNREIRRERRKRERELERAWHCVYLMYDAKGRLLYVGISVNGPSRINGHAGVNRPRWWRKVARMDVEHVKGRAAALERELEAIRALDPIWNVAGKERV